MDLTRLPGGSCDKRRSRLGYRPATVPAGFMPVGMVLSPAASKLSRSGLLAFQEEAVKCVARINEASDDRPRRVVDRGEGALAYTCARARGIKRGKAAVLIPQEAVIRVTCVDVISRDRPHWVDGLAERPLAGTFTRAWNIERDDGAVSGAQVAVPYVARVKVLSSNRTCRVDA